MPSKDASLLLKSITGRRQTERNTFRPRARRAGRAIRRRGFVGGFGRICVGPV